MNKIEKISLARIVSDLIKADTIIDAREMNIYKRIKKKYTISQDCLCDMRYLTFSDAVNNLAYLTLREKEELMELFKDISLADKMCNKNEALLLLALEYCLSDECDAEMITVQFPVQSIQFIKSQVLYVESEYEQDINQTIQDNYYQIDNTMRLAGFDFAYIPHIIQTYENCTPEDLFRDVLNFITPNIRNNELNEKYQRLLEMSTSSFCKEHLCKKLCIRSLEDTTPSLLINVGNTIIEDNTYANFLKIEVTDSIKEEIKQLLYRFTSMLNAEYLIVKNVYNSPDRFIYSGVYKQIIDLCLMDEVQMSTILLDTFNQKILFPEINEELGVYRSDKALYILILVESITGGMNMLPNNKNVRYKRRLKSKYEKIYNLIGGDCNRIPDIFDQRIRNPRISRINRKIKQITAATTSQEDYLIKRTKEGLYKINLDTNMIYGINDINEPEVWNQMDTWKRIISI